MYWNDSDFFNKNCAICEQMKSFDKTDTGNVELLVQIFTRYSLSLSLFNCNWQTHTIKIIQMHAEESSFHTMR